MQNLTVVGNLWDEAERDRLGAWVLSGMMCMAIQRLCRIAIGMVWSIPLWSPPEPLAHAMARYLKEYAYLDLWGDVIMIGAVVGVVGYIAQQREAEKRLFGAWQKLFIYALLIMLIEEVYLTTLSYLRTNEGLSFLYMLGLSVARLFHWNTLIRLGILIFALRLIPEVAAGLDQIFTTIRERYLS